MKNKLFFSIVFLCFSFIFNNKVFAYVGNIASNGANLRNEASIDSKVLAKLSSNTEVTILGKEMTWYYVDASGTNGYIYEKLLNIDDETKKLFDQIKENYELLSEFTSSFNTSVIARNHNIEKSAFKNNIILKPNEMFSFNKNTGNSTLISNGWREAGVLVNKELTTGIGGGICQTSSTIHGAVMLLPELKIIERRKHSVPVMYVKVEQEAMVNYGSSDFRFRNDYDFDIFIFNSVDHTSGKVRSQIYKIGPEIVAPEPQIEPIDYRTENKIALINGLKKINDNPSFLLDLIGIDKTNITFANFDNMFTVEDVNGDGFEDLILESFINITFEIDGEIFVKVLEYKFVFTKFGDDIELKLIYKIFEDSPEVLIDFSLYSKVSDYKRTYFVIDNKNQTVKKINENFEEVHLISMDLLNNEYIKLHENKQNLNAENIVKFAESEFFKPQIIPMIVVNGQNFNYNVSPQIIENRVYIEMRSLFENLGYNVLYNQASKSIEFFNENQRFYLHEGATSKTIIRLKNDMGEEIPIAFPMKIVDDKLMFPLRFAGELLEMGVFWDNESYTASLNNF